MVVHLWSVKVLKQTYSTENLAKVIRKRHIIAWNLWCNNQQKGTKLEELIHTCPNNFQNGVIF